MTIDEKISYTLDEASHSLQLLQDNFYIIGSAALSLTGTKLDEMNDIDILTSTRDAVFLGKEWGNRFIEGNTMKDDELFLSKFARYKFSVLDIEIMGELKVNKNGIWERLKITECESIATGGFEIKIPTLEEQKRILQLFGRVKDMQRIKLIDKQLFDQSKSIKPLGN
jgi:hypothetical protein